MPLKGSLVVLLPMCPVRTLGWLGWETGFEPATFGATVRRSTS